MPQLNPSPWFSLLLALWLLLTLLKPLLLQLNLTQTPIKPSRQQHPSTWPWMWP